LGASPVHPAPGGLRRTSPGVLPVQDATDGLSRRRVPNVTRV
jgi:hypothetical protein